MNRYPTPSRLRRAVFFIVAVASSLLTLGSMGGLAEHYANGAPSAQEMALAMPAAATR